MENENNIKDIPNREETSPRVLPNAFLEQASVENLYTIDVGVFEPGNETLMHEKIADMISSAQEASLGEGELAMNASGSEIVESEIKDIYTNTEGFEEINEGEIIEAETNSAGEALISAVNEGKIPGVTTEDLEKPGVFEALLESPIGKKVMSAVKVMMLSTALIAPMKSAHADTVGDLSRAAETWGNQKVENETTQHEREQRMEADFELRQQQMESNITNQRNELESRLKQTTAQKNSQYKSELSQAHSEEDKAKILTRQDKDWENFVSRSQMERTHLEDRASFERQRFASDIRTQRQRTEIEKQSQNTRINTQAGGQAVRAILNNVLKR